MHTLFKKIIKYATILLIVLASTSVWAAAQAAAEEPAAEEIVGDEKVGGLDEGRKWIPEVWFPPFDPAQHGELDRRDGQRRH